MESDWLADCDVCGKPSRFLEQSFEAGGVETWSCPRCREEAMLDEICAEDPEGDLAARELLGENWRDKVFKLVTAFQVSCYLLLLWAIYVVLKAVF